MLIMMLLLIYYFYPKYNNIMNKLITTSLLALSVVFFTSCNEGNASSKVKKENVDTAKKRDTEINLFIMLLYFG